jgi:hypothetical protein
MADDLGGRLARAGLVTRDDLAEIVATAPAHDAAFVRALVRRGVSEDAIAGFFLSEGFGPLLSRSDLGRADGLWASRLPARMALDFLAVPIRAATDGIVVAMAAPSDDHLVHELSRVLGARAIATIARASDIEGCVRAAHPDVSSEPPRRMDSEPPVLELTRRRPPVSFDGGYRAPDREGGKDAKLGPRLALPDDEPAMPLVRHKPQTMPAPVRMSERPADVVVVKTFANPDTKRAQWVKPQEDVIAQTAEYPRPPPSIPPDPARGHEPRKTAPMLEAVDPSPSVVPVGAPPPRSSPPAVAFADPNPPARAASEPAASEERWDLPSQPAVATRAPSVRPAAREAANKLGARAAADLPTLKAAPGEIGTVLAAIRGAEDRDQVVKLACEGATSVCRTAVFFALRKGVLKGWDGNGPGIRRDSVRNLWIPTSSPSTFKKVLDTRQGHIGPYGTSIADGLFRAAVGSRGGDLMIQPVLVGGKAVGFLCADDLRPGPIGAHRVEVLAQAVADAFVRIISAGKD